jgi:hypothetical protein
VLRHDVQRIRMGRNSRCGVTAAQGRDEPLLSALDGQFPPVAIRIVEP